LVLGLLGRFYPQQPGHIMQFSTDAIFPIKNGPERSRLLLLMILNYLHAPGPPLQI
jgi:hypothetical protein